MQNDNIGQVSSSNSLSTERIGTLLFRLSIPSMIALLVNSMYQVVDNIILHFCYYHMQKNILGYC